MNIVLYDVPSTSPGYSMSLNTWRTRYCLNYKGLPFITEWVEFPHLESLYAKLGIVPKAMKANGSPHYTVPVIYDPLTNKSIYDSMAIAEYLDQQYSDTPQIFPHNTIGLAQTFTEAFMSYIPPARELLIWTIFVCLRPPSIQYFRDDMEAKVGKKLEDLVPDDQLSAHMTALQGVLEKINNLYAKNAGKGPFIMGEELSWADVVVAGFLMCFRVSTGEDSQKWKEIISWHDGRWTALMENMRKYE
ncbi:Glutathione S-transferase-like protein ustS [Psilocybe cubensis]|uniref:Glutathione S-transferase-like protein ustS n=2 Tax=Psilocybe cubensis TaxID=181762 RepID=A0ACB8GZ72_PSICU|nr:Glutathione S-transferase-like protein ustS [Psilocybe cubensis]KAH9480823.1 Glutathione S-transferase-like protein ustS [Psilocybe cubensis]